ncbi:hypothetical protein BMS81_10335, partial [Leuconostoc pseudomesenteroides]
IVPHAIITRRSRQALMDTIQGGISWHIGHERLRKLVDQLMSMGQISAPAVAALILKKWTIFIQSIK